MSRADYLGKQFFKIAQLTNSSICYKNTFLSPRSSVRIQLTIALHLPNLKLFVTSCHKYVGSASPFLSVSPSKTGNLNQKVYSHLWQGSWRLALDWKKPPMLYITGFARTILFFFLPRVPASSRFSTRLSPRMHRRALLLGQRTGGPWGAGPRGWNANTAEVVRDALCRLSLATNKAAPSLWDAPGSSSIGKPYHLKWKRLPVAEKHRAMSEDPQYWLWSLGPGATTMVRQNPTCQETSLTAAPPVSIPSRSTATAAVRGLLVFKSN